MRRFCAFIPKGAARGWVAPELPACYAASRRALSTPWSKSNPDEHKNRTKRRRPVGFRLWIADVAAGIRFPGAARRPPGGRPPGALRLFIRPSRHSATARPCARPRPRRQLPRRRLPGGGRQAYGHDRLFAGPRAGHQGLSRGLARGLARRRPAAKRPRALLRGGSRPPAICRPPPPRPAIALCAPGPRPLRRLPRLRAGGGQGTASARLSRRRLAPVGRADQGHPRIRRALSIVSTTAIGRIIIRALSSVLPGGPYASSAAACRNLCF